MMDAAMLVMGVGTHMDARIAVLRALTEVAQSRATQIQGAREDTDREKVTRSIGYERMKRINRHWYGEARKKYPWQSCRTSRPILIRATSRRP